MVIGVWLLSCVKFCVGEFYLCVVILCGDGYSGWCGVWVGG